MKEHNLNPTDFVMDEIESIELIGDKPTIDITVDGTHMFFANDIYTHNCGAGEDIVEASHISDSYRKIMTADFILSMSRKTNDKANNTARFHVIKNRFGPDGITLYAKMNAGNGDIRIYDEKARESAEIKATMQDEENDTRSLLQKKWNQKRSDDTGNDLDS